MSSGRDDEKPSRPPAPERKRDHATGLLTSQDIFGDLLDSGQPAAPASLPAGGARRGPIKVQVSESMGKPAQVPAQKASPPTEEAVLPADMAALLEALSAAESAVAPASVPPEDTPREAVAPEEPAPPPEPPAASDAEPVEAPPALLPQREHPGGGDEDVLEDMAGLLEDAERLLAQDRQDRADEPSAREAFEDLVQLRLPSRRRREAEGTGHEARPAARFNVQAPVPPPEGAGLDLAALAEHALGRPASRPEGPGEGKQYGPYRLLHREAMGGMAEVWRAKRSGVEGFEKVLAVKRILPHLSENKEFVDMFVDEAKMVAGLAHPNIVQIFDLGRIERSYYIAMEYVHGHDLKTILRQAKERGMRVPLDLSVLIASRVCLALEFAHRARDGSGQPMLLVHRDVSPQNILISFEGEVKLTDFGIAKAASKATVTDAGALRGKLLYMSPEQAWGKPIDKRSDIFSLGLVLYEMVADQKPFLGNSEMSILESVRQCQIAPPATLNARIPPRLDEVIMRALHKEPDYRYQDAGEMYRGLERVLHDRQPLPADALAHFMRTLFEVDGAEASPPPLEATAEAPETLDVEFEDAVEPDEAPAPLPDDEPEERPASEGLSIQKLLKRFRIK